ncbi:MAG: pyridoxamine 5'-phosphate oxidase family protein [Methanomicrobiaceae archaeon]|nr:pyridoxamine 5'-phosphate oxidase family protein [Methanomicrobiaceae archaeon]
MSSKLKEYFNNPARVGILGTADRSGKVNSSLFGSGSSYMTDERTVVVGMEKTRTLANLQENPHALFTIMEPGETLADWKGVRVYLEVNELAISGPMFEDLKRKIARYSGEGAANLIDAAVQLEVTEVRPLMGIGQRWEQSI